MKHLISTIYVSQRLDNTHIARKRSTQERLVMTYPRERPDLGGEREEHGKGFTEAEQQKASSNQEQDLGCNRMV